MNDSKELSRIYTLVRAGHDPDTKQLHLSEQEFKEAIQQYCDRRVREARKEFLKETNGIAGALGKFAERSAKKPHKHWYIGKNRQGNVVFFPEEKGKPFNEALRITVKTMEEATLKKHQLTQAEDKLDG